jgi:hypothetical protein
MVMNSFEEEEEKNCVVVVFFFCYERESDEGVEEENVIPKREK